MIERRTIVSRPEGDWYFIPAGDIVVRSPLLPAGSVNSTPFDRVELTVADLFVLAADDQRPIVVPDVGRFLVTRENPFTGDAA